MRIEPAYQSLAYYEAKAKAMPVAEIRHALIDVQVTISAFKERPLSDPYVAKLWAEFDAYSNILRKRSR